MQVSAAVCRIFWMQCSAVLPEWAMELRFAGRKKQSGSAETDTLESRCVRSAICTKAVKDPADYPIQEFLRENLLVTINTDNRMVSQTTLEKEFAFLREQYAVTREQEVQMTKNAIEVAFASDEVKAQLWKAMEL